MPSRRFQAAFCVALFCTAALSPLAVAQPLPPERIEGRITSDRPTAFERLTVAVLSTSGGGSARRAAVASDGSFEIEAGDWPASDWLEIVVLTNDGTEIQRQPVSLVSGLVTIRLRGEPAAQPVQGVVSLEDLADPPSKKFRKEMRRSQQALGRNDLVESAQHLARAVELEPRRLDAQLSLGILALRMNDHSTALDAFGAAVRIAPDSEPALAGRAMALHGLGRLAQAEEQARTALLAHPRSSRCHYVLGLVQAQTGKRGDEVLAHLRQAEREYPQALLVKAVVHADRGEAGRAEESLRRCVRLVDAGSAHYAACRDRLAALEK